jgi:predicted  nucleic acid-binding Zn-ribbon protein
VAEHSGTNKYFEDTKYYLKRAAETAKRGVEEEIGPLQDRVQELIGEEEPEPEPSRVEQLREDLNELQTRAEGEAKKALNDARDRLDQVGGESDAEDNS